MPGMLKQPNTPIAQQRSEMVVVLMLLIFFPAVWALMAFTFFPNRRPAVRFLFSWPVCQPVMFWR
jgi:hypothetical protein